MANLSDKHANLMSFIARNYEKNYGHGIFAAPPIDLDEEFAKIAAPPTYAEPETAPSFNFNQHGLA